MSCLTAAAELTPRATTPWTLKETLRGYFRLMAITYALFNLENVLVLARPYVLGMAIDDLLRGSLRGVLVLAVQHVAYAGLGTFRRRYDTRVYTALYTDLATRMVLGQRSKQVEASRVAARSALSREVVDFFEHHVPCLLHTGYAIFGSLLLLAWCDGRLASLCLLISLPVLLLSRRFAGQSHALNRQLNDQLEREVETIMVAEPTTVRQHYADVAQWRTRLSDIEAGSFGVMALAMAVMLCLAVVRAWQIHSTAPGQIFATVGYVIMWMSALAVVPLLVQQMARLRDIRSRLS